LRRDREYGITERMYEMSREPHQEGGVYLLAHTSVELQLAEFIEEHGEPRLLAVMRETEKQIAAGQAQQLRQLAQFAAMRPLRTTGRSVSSPPTK
jgi:hypothetical protein